MTFFRKILILFFFFISFVNIFSQLSNSERFEISKQTDIFNAIFNELNLYYVDSLDVKQIIQTTIAYMLQSLDPYTEYIPFEDLANFQFQKTGKYGGIGAIIAPRDSQMIILDIYEGMPADLAGFKLGDEILAINGERMSGKTASFASKSLKGQPNTYIKVEYRKPNSKNSQIITIKRDRIQIDPISYYGVVENEIGYISISSFTSQSSLFFKKALVDLTKNHLITSLIIDLRNNGGGLVNECLEILNFFLPKGELLLFTKSKVSYLDKTYYANKSPLAPILPLAILVNENSASASEIFAGTIQDTDRGIIVGSHTYGKGLVQSTFSLPYRGELKLSTARYYIPSGRCIQSSINHYPPLITDDQNTEHISDTLIHTYYTANHRQVISENGIFPDFTIKEEPIPSIVLYLKSHWIFLDFIIQWQLKHPSIDHPENFVVNKEIYQEFKKFIKNQVTQSNYNSKSEKILKSLKKTMEFEGYFEEAKEEFYCLKNKINSSLQHDLNLYKESIANYLALTMMKYYYFSKGEIIYQLHHDPILDRTTKILKDKILYNSILCQDS